MKLFTMLFPLGLCSTQINAQDLSRAEKAPQIKWMESTLRKVAPVSGNGNANYARLTQLHNCDLICVYENASGVQCAMNTDTGNTWLQGATVAESQPGLSMATPDVIELLDHSLLAAYNPRPKKGNRDWKSSQHFAIRTKKSYDNGKTWKEERVLYEAGYTFGDGCWEPALLQLPGGEVQLFFSNEGIYTTTNEQNISLFRSRDNGLSWTLQPQIVSFTPGHRDGMPVPIMLQSGDSVLLSIEDNISGQFKPAIIRNSRQTNWRQPVGEKDSHRNQALQPALPDTVYAGAPFLRQLHGGKMVLSYQGTMQRSNNWELACMQVAVGDPHGRNFKNVDPPFSVPPYKHGLWNSICILNDDTIIAVTSTDAYSSNTAIWMIKGKLVNQ